MRQRSAPERPENAGLLDPLRAGLRSPDPIDLLSTVSALLTVTDPRRVTPFSGPLTTTRESLVESFIGTQFAETTAALYVIRALLPDPELREEITAELEHRRHPMPLWLTRLEEARVEPDVWFLTHVQGDGDDYLFAVTLATGEEITALVYVDHNMGTLVKDAFPIPQPLSDVVIELGTRIDRAEQVLTRIDAATARAAVGKAIERGAMTVPPPESDTWPQFRPMLEWMLRMLPEGGTPPEHREWTEEETAAITTEFLASPFGERFKDDDDGRDLLENILWFGTSYAGTDPYRWSPVNVEILMTDWFPRKVMADPEYLARMPEVLREFIRYAHDRNALPAHLTEETLAAVDHWEPQYQQAIRGTRGGVAGLAAALMAKINAGELDPSVLDGGMGLSDRDLADLGLDWDDYFGEEDEDDEVLEPVEVLIERNLASVVGGHDALASLGVEPLPDEPFDWEDIPENIQPVVQEVLEVCDRAADEILDVELRTAMRRFLGRVAAADPAIFRRRASTQRTAAAVAWVICQANHDFGRVDPNAPVRELLAHFGVKGSVTERAQQMLSAVGVRRWSGPIHLGTPELLTSRARAQIVRARERPMWW